MHLRSNRVFVQTASFRLASVSTSQKLNSVTAQESCQSKTFHPPTPRGKKRERERDRKRTKGVAGPRPRPTDPPRVAKSPTQLTNISMGITLPPREMEIIPLTGGISIQSPNYSSHALWSGYSLTPGQHYNLNYN
jgi:hypothetical protein